GGADASPQPQRRTSPRRPQQPAGQPTRPPTGRVGQPPAVVAGATRAGAQRPPAERPTGRAMTATNVGRAAVRVAGLNLDDGAAFVRIGHGAEVRVRWRRVGRRVRWRCDAHPDATDCTHARAVTWHVTGAAMKETHEND